MEDVILYNESVDEVYVEGAISFVEKLKRLWKTFLDLLKRIKIKLKMVFNKDMRQFNKFRYIIESPGKYEKEVGMLKNTSCDKWDTDYTKKLFTKCNELCTLILDFKFKIGPILGGNKITYDISSGAESMFRKLETVDDEIKQMTKTKPTVIKDGWSKYDAIKTLIEEYKLMREYFIHFDDVERFCGDIDHAINHYHDKMTSDTIECLTKLVKLWTNSFTHMRDIFDITSHVSSAMAFEDSKKLSLQMNQHVADSGMRAKKKRSDQIENDKDTERRKYEQHTKTKAKDNDEHFIWDHDIDSNGFTEHERYVMTHYDHIMDKINKHTHTDSDLSWLSDHTDEYNRLKKRIPRSVGECYTKGVMMMEDVILYNESWNIDKLSPYNTFYMEGSIIDGLKRLWQAFLNMLKRIKQRLQYMFNSDARIYRKVVQGLKIPSVVADWKETRCTKRDYSVLKELLAKGIELCDCILSIKDVFENVEVVDGHATWTPSEISKLGNNNKDIIKINGELKTITTKKQQAPVENGQTVYDLATEWVEIYELTVRYLMRHDKVIEFTKEIDKIVKSLPENQATVTSKLMQNWITGLSYLHNVEGPAGPMINARVDSRDGFVQIKTMLDENSKLLEKALKTTREANAEADKSIKDTEKFMRNNKNLLKKYAPWKEYYTEGMTDMDTIIYKDDQPENDGEITTESANEEPTIDEVNAYIEYAMNDLHDAMELRNRIIQESDDDTVEDFEESDTTDETPDAVDDVEECGDGCKPTTEYYSDAIVRNYNEPVQENKTYCLKTNDMFTTESYDEPTGPDRFVQEYNPDTKAAVLGGILGYSAHTTLLIAGVTTNVMGIVKAVDSIIASATYKKKYGRFAEDMKAVMDILKESKDGTIKTGLLNKALHTLKDDCDTISGKGIISRKAMVNLTATERSEIKQLSAIIKDLERMLTSKPNKAAERRIPARIEDFVKKCETVTKLLNRGKNPGDVVKEYMS